MLTIFTAPKPFIRHDNIIQRNAIKSWTLLQPECEIILLGDDEGTAEVASEVGVNYCPEIQRNEFGTPLLNSIFSIAQEKAHNNIMCYVNADIIILSEFLPTLQQILSNINTSGFLMIGQRWDLDIETQINFKEKNWETRLRKQVEQYGHFHAKTGIDYFVYPKGIFDYVPPFAVGRTAWDHWLVYQARYLKAEVIDVSKVVMVIHQNHGYSHVQDGYQGAWKGIEAIRNQELAGYGARSFSLEYTTAQLSNAGVIKKTKPSTITQILLTLLYLNSLFKFITFLLEFLVRVIRHIRGVYKVSK